MDVSRRFLLKGMAVGTAATLAGAKISIADPLATPLATLRETTAGQLAAKPVIALVNSNYAPTAFTEGLQQAKPVVERTILQNAPLDLAQINKLLAQKDHHIIGLVDDASAAIFVQVARQQGAKVHWVGQHAINARSTNHNILRSGNSESCSATLQANAAACQQPHNFNEQGLAQALPAATQTAAHPQQWVADLAVSLASLSQGSAQQTAAAPIAHSVPTIKGTAVSLFIET